MNTTNKISWGFKRIWTQRKQTFSVEVSCHEVAPSEYPVESGPYRWCVYCYIYPTHPIFPSIKENEKLWPIARWEMPLHGGISYFKIHRNHGDMNLVDSYQIGCDYNHLGDDAYTHDQEGATVFWDAEQLIKYLENYEREPVAELL